jgi:hypothetical protein
VIEKWRLGKTRDFNLKGLSFITVTPIVIQDDVVPNASYQE